MRKQWILSLAALIFFTSASVYSGTLFEEEKTLRDPYIAEQGGFNSLFVNPAGTAGQSEFQISAQAGVRASVNDYSVAKSLYSLWDDISKGGLSRDGLSVTAETLSELSSKDLLSKEFYEAVFDGTSLSPVTRGEDFWKDSQRVQAAIRDSSFTDTDLEKIEQNYKRIIEDPSKEAKIFEGIKGNPKVMALGTIKAGILVQGFGFGAYGHARGTGYINPGEREIGVRDVYGEVGLITGLGLNFLEGKLAVGASLNYGVLVKKLTPISVTKNFIDFNTLLSDKIAYGYTWGLDVGMIFRPSPDFGVGVVLNDLVGTTESGTKREANGINDLFGSSGKFLPQNLNYKVTLDADVGIFWQPSTGVVKPKLGVDLLNVVSYVQNVSKNNIDAAGAVRLAFDNARIGAGLNIADVLDLGIQHYGQYTRAGIGLNLLFFGIYGEFKIHDDIFKPNTSFSSALIGTDLTVSISF